jgi:hypothetical protein
MEFAIMPFISPLGIEGQTYGRVFGEAELLDIAIPVTDGDEEFFGAISRRIHTQVPVVNIKLQESVVYKRPHLWGYIHAGRSPAPYSAATKAPP